MHFDINKKIGVLEVQIVGALDQMAKIEMGNFGNKDVLTQFALLKDSSMRISEQFEGFLKTVDGRINELSEDITNLRFLVESDEKDDSDLEIVVKNLSAKLVNSEAEIQNLFVRLKKLEKK